MTHKKSYGCPIHFPGRFMHRFGLKHAEFSDIDFNIYTFFKSFIFAINSAIYILFTLRTGSMMLVCNLN